jgi:hypothetical protein
MQEHWRYLIARYGALPVVWCAAGEGTMPFYGSARAQEEAALQKTGWTQVIRHIRATDPFRRMITIHPSRSARETVSDPSILDFDMHQTGHLPEGAIGKMAQQIYGAYQVQPAMPVIASGGSIPWDDAMNGPGSGEVGLAKKFLAQFPWQHFEPVPDSAVWADDQPTTDDVRTSAAGIATQLRIIYIPQALAITVTQLAGKTDYTVNLFDPVLGGQTPLGQATTDEAGTWRCSPPNQNHDWVLVLEKRSK